MNILGHSVDDWFPFDDWSRLDLPAPRVVEVNCVGVTVVLCMGQNMEGVEFCAMRFENLFYVHFCALAVDFFDARISRTSPMNYFRGGMLHRLQVRVEAEVTEASLGSGALGWP